MDVELDFARVTTPLFENLDLNGIVELVGLGRFHDTVAAGVSDFLLRHRGAGDVQWGER